MAEKIMYKSEAGLFFALCNSTDSVTGTQIGKACKLSVYWPIYLQMFSSPCKKIKGFWRYDNSLLRNMEFIVGCNDVIASQMKAYSSSLNYIQNPTAEQCTMAKFDISYTLLHHVNLMEVHAFAMNFVAEKKREEQRR